MQSTLKESKSTASQRKIIHIDCDCFYAAIEMRDDPSLIDLPIAVGGSSDRRGVICTCNYEARRYGIHSAMSSAQARKLCPQLILLPVRFEQYREASKAIREIFDGYSNQIQPLSLDEAFLDVSNSPHCHGSATWIAQEIKAKVKQQVGITVSAGVAPNKFIAKVASDWNKPDGLCVVTPEEVDEFVEQLPVRKLCGVGKVTTEKLHRENIYTCGDIRAYPKEQFLSRYGRFGRHLFQLAHGIDDRPVRAEHERKSISVENTYPSDLPDLDTCYKSLPGLLNSLKQRLKRANTASIYKIFVKMKFNDFSTTTAETLSKGLSPVSFSNLCKESFSRRELPVRLLGVGVRFQKIVNTSDQLAFDF